METKPTRIPINYLYFGAFFLLLTCISTGSVFIKEDFVGSRFFFLLYALGQTILEISGFIFLAFLIERYAKPIYFWIFIGITFCLAIFHILDFLMDRIVDLSVWDMLGIILDESLHDFIFLLDASGIPFWAWGGLLVLIISLPLVGIGLYKICLSWVKKRPFSLNMEWFLQAFVCIPLALLLWDISASRIIHPDAYHALVKSLPWKFTFLEPKNIFISPQNPLLQPPDEKAVAIALNQVQIVPAKKPNIYLFIIESLRGDFITPEIAPHLSQFKDHFNFYETSVSNANGTNQAWFSIFHSQFSMYWNEYRKNVWSMGSPALQLLKKLGYQIRVYTSAQLGYYGMDKLIFGKNLELIDSLNPFYHTLPTQAWESDEKTVSTALKDLAGSSVNLLEGQVFIFFWDATHFDYSWPKDHPSKFTPTANQIAYFKMMQTAQNIERIKNNYRNSVHYVDSLFGEFWKNLPRKEEAIVAVLGDHGEEFFEKGHLFHNSHLVDEQTLIPFYVKLGDGKKKPLAKTLVSQMDLFPSLIDYLTDETFSFLHGESMFRESKWPFAMICRFNGGKTSYEFSFHNGKHKVVAQFLEKDNVFAAQPLKIRSLWNCKSGDISECKLSVESWIQDEFAEAFNRLFPTPKYPDALGDRK